MTMEFTSFLGCLCVRQGLGETIEIMLKGNRGVGEDKLLKISLL